MGVEELLNEGQERTAAAFQNVKPEERVAVLRSVNYHATYRDLGLKPNEIKLKSLRWSIGRISRQKFDVNNEEDERRAAAAVVNIFEATPKSTTGLTTFFSKVDMCETKRILGYPGTEQSLRKYLVKAVRDARKAKGVLENSEEESIADDDAEVSSGNKRVVIDISDDEYAIPVSSAADDGDVVRPGKTRRNVTIDLASDSEDDGADRTSRTHMAAQTANRVATVNLASDNEDNGDVQSGGPRKAASQREIIDLVSDDEDDGAVPTGAKRKFAGSAHAARKTRKLDDTERKPEDVLANQTQNGDVRVAIVDNSGADNQLSFILAGLKINTEDRPTPNSQSSLLVRLKIRPNVRTVSANQPSLMVRLKIRPDRRPASTNQPSPIVRLKIKNKHEAFDEAYSDHIHQPHDCGPHCPKYMGGLECLPQSAVGNTSPTPMKYEGFAGLYSYEPNRYGNANGQMRE